MTNGRVLAIDGGQSGIRLLDNRGSLSQEIPGISRLEGDPLATIASQVSAVLESDDGEPVDTLVFALSTVPATQADAEAFAREVQRQIPTRYLIVTDDAVAHHAALFQALPGIGLAVGTGVACTAVDTNQTFFSVSGYGFLLGDDGGAFWLGREAIRTVLDRRYVQPQGALSDLLREEFGELETLPARIHSLERPVNDVAQAAPQIMALAATDSLAEHVVNIAIDKLVETVSRAVHAAEGLEQPVLRWTSKLFSAQPQWAQKLSDALQERTAVGRVEHSHAVPLAGAQWIGETADRGAYGPHLFEFDGTEGTEDVS